MAAPQEVRYLVGVDVDNNVDKDGTLKLEIELYEKIGINHVTGKCEYELMKVITVQDDPLIRTIKENPKDSMGNAFQHSLAYITTFSEEVYKYNTLDAANSQIETIILDRGKYFSMYCPERSLPLLRL